ncbi:MAG TPA: hypothetical protein VN692_07075 [Steroidobacteraceae bacterium]|jgi:hypothetical protein|nr:hypothetical protein [Steroidobacteraceae bacterium]
MSRTFTTLLVAGLLGFGFQAVADEAISDQAPQSHKQFMKDCMAKAKAANNGMSEKDMKKSCMEQLKATVDNPNKEPMTPAH